MTVYRIVKSKTRTADLSGTGAFRTGGRWNSEGTYMLYTSSTVSLSLLENLVHFELADCPPHLYLMHIELAPKVALYTLPEDGYPPRWQELEQAANKAIGDRFCREMGHLALKVRSAVNPMEYNYLLNPLFPRFHDLVKISKVEKLPFDPRLVK